MVLELFLTIMILLQIRMMKSDTRGRGNQIFLILWQLFLPNQLPSPLHAFDARMQPYLQRLMIILFGAREVFASSIRICSLHCLFHRSSTIRHGLRRHSSFCAQFYLHTKSLKYLPTRRGCSTFLTKREFYGFSCISRRCNGL